MLRLHQVQALLQPPEAGVVPIEHDQKNSKTLEEDRLAESDDKERRIEGWKVKGTREEKQLRLEEL